MDVNPPHDKKIRVLVVYGTRPGLAPDLDSDTREQLRALGHID